MKKKIIHVYFNLFKNILFGFTFYIFMKHASFKVLCVKNPDNTSYYHMLNKPKYVIPAIVIFFCAMNL